MSGKQSKKSKGSGQKKSGVTLKTPMGEFSGRAGQLLAPNPMMGQPTVGPTQSRNARRRKRRREQEKRRKDGPWQGLGVGVGRTGAANPSMLGKSSEGIAWGIYHMHPAVEEQCKVVPAMPDGAGGQVVTCTHRGAVEIAAPTGSTDDWDCVVVQFGSPEYGTTYIRGPVGWTDRTPTNSNSSVTAVLVAEAMNLVRSGAGKDSNTWVKSAISNLTDCEWYSACPTSLLTPNGGEFLTWRSFFRTFRFVGISHTTELMSSITTNQGRVVCGQFSADAREAAITNSITTALAAAFGRLLVARDAAGSAIAVDPGVIRSIAADVEVTTKQVWCLAFPKATMNGIVIGDHAHVDWPAVDGIYVPLRSWTVEHSRMQTDPLREIDLDPDVGADGGITSKEELSGPCILDPAYGVSVAIFTGLDPKSTLKSRYVYHIETTVDGGSSWAPFAHAAPDRDDLALETVEALRSKMKHAFSADEMISARC